MDAAAKSARRAPRACRKAPTTNTAAAVDAHIENVSMTCHASRQPPAQYRRMIADIVPQMRRHDEPKFVRRRRMPVAFLHPAAVRGRARFIIAMKNANLSPRCGAIFTSFSPCAKSNVSYDFSDFRSVTPFHQPSSTPAGAAAVPPLDFNAATSPAAARRPTPCATIAVAPVGSRPPPGAGIVALFFHGSSESRREKANSRVAQQ